MTIARGGKVFAKMENQWQAIIVASIAAVVALVGYLINQQADRRQDRARFYSNALRAVKEVEELPYRISERDRRSSAAKALSDAFVEVAFFKAWLYIDDEIVGVVYDILSQRSIVTGAGLRTAAWESPVAPDSRAGMNDYDYFDSKPEWNLCIAVMRNELRLVPALGRRRLRVAVADHIERRRAEGFDSNSDVLGTPWDKP